MKFLNFFRNDLKRESPDSNDISIFFHEDFYRQIDFVLEENYFERSHYISNLPENETSEYGFERCNVRAEIKIPLSSKSILIDEFNFLLEPIASSYFTRVEAGYSNNSYKMENTLVWGFEGYGIFLECDAKRIMQALYICHNHNFRVKENDGTSLARGLWLLGTEFKLVLIDWNEEIIVRISDKKSAIRYVEDVLYLNVNRF